MRKALVALFLLTCMSSFAQSTIENAKPYYFYLQMHPFAWASSKEWRGDVCIDSYDPYIICDDNNEKMTFSGPMQIVNYLSKVGWEFVNFENVNGHFYYIFRKLVTKDEDAKLDMNLLTADEIKKAKKK